MKLNSMNGSRDKWLLYKARRAEFHFKKSEINDLLKDFDLGHLRIALKIKDMKNATIK